MTRFIQCHRVVDLAGEKIANIKKKKKYFAGFAIEYKLYYSTIRFRLIIETSVLSIREIQGIPQHNSVAGE